MRSLATVTLSTRILDGSARACPSFGLRNARIKWRLLTSRRLDARLRAASEQHFVLCHRADNLMLSAGKDGDSSAIVSGFSS